MNQRINQRACRTVCLTAGEAVAGEERELIAPAADEAQAGSIAASDQARLRFPLCADGRLLLERTTQPPAPGADGRRRYRAVFVSAGRVRAAGNRRGVLEVAPAAVQGAVEGGLLDGRPCFVDHAGHWQPASLRDLAGVTSDAAWDRTAQTAGGVVTLYPTPAGDAVQALFDALLADGEAGRPTPDVGLSLVFWPERIEPDGEGQTARVLEIRHVESVDFVFEPAANGRIRALLSAQSNQQEKGASVMTEPNVSHQAGAAPQPAHSAPDPVAAEWTDAIRRTAIPAVLAACGLPAASRERLAAQRFETPAELEHAVEEERAYLARLTQDQVIQVGAAPPRSPQIALGRTGLEQVQLAAEAMLAGVRPPDGIQPLTGIRELYHLLSGDYEMAGLYRPERISLANVTASTMAGLVANALNKRVVNFYREYPRWWEPIVTVEDFDSLQDVRWITLGGVGELPTVAEGAAYTELTWDDQTETDAFVKKGGYLGITLEAIDKDDTYRLRAAPRALAQAAWLTLSKAVSAIFTASSGTGPAMSDSNHLFDASNHGNLRTTALSFAEYTAVRNAMRKQTELNSGERLGALTAPRFLLAPPDLEITALQVLASEGQPGTADNDANPFAEGDTFDARMRSARQRVIVVDLWTDSNDWAAVADPRLYPSIGLGFRYGRVPEIYSVASPTAGLMFSNDVMPVKVRFFFAVGPTDWRGLHKNNVS